MRAHRNEAALIFINLVAHRFGVGTLRRNIDDNA